jgi:hypothetical protein
MSVCPKCNTLVNDDDHGSLTRSGRSTGARSDNGYVICHKNQFKKLEETTNALNAFVVFFLIKYIWEVVTNLSEGR